MRNLSIIIVVCFLGITSCNQDDDAELPHKQAIDLENIFYQKDYIFSNNRKVKVKFDFDSPIFNWNLPQKISVKVVSFKKKNNGKWKKFRTNIHAGYQGKLAPIGTCNTQAIIAQGKTKKRRRLKYKKYEHQQYCFKQYEFFANVKQEGNQVLLDFW